MGQKVHPGGLRVGVIHDWKSNWYTTNKEFKDALLEDIKIREHINRKLGHAGLSDILIRKDKQRITIDIYTARPGIVIGKSGVEVDALRKDVHGMTHKNVHININEIKRPELDAKLVAQSIAEQLENRVSFRRAMKRSLASAMRSGAHGVKIKCGGRLGGGEMSRVESYSEGRVPLHTIRADIDYGSAEAKTTFGRIGVKVWINKGEIMPEGYEGVTHEGLAARRAGPGPPPRRRERGPLGLPRERARPPGRPRGPRPGAPAPRRRRRSGRARRGRGGGGGARPRPWRRWRRRARGDRVEQPRAEETHAAAAEQPQPVDDAGSRDARVDGRAPGAAGRRGPRRRSAGGEDRLMLLPKKTKYRKQQRGRRAGTSKGQTSVAFGDYGLKSLDAGWLTNRQIEAARIAMTRKIKRGGKVWINIFPDKPVTQKPAETRMGSGKGSPEHWVAVVKPGRVMFELAGVPEPLAKEALRLAGTKLSVRTKVVKREADLFE